MPLRDYLPTGGSRVQNELQNDVHSSLTTIERRCQKSLPHRLADLDANNQLQPNQKSLTFLNNLKCYLPIRSSRKRKREDGSNAQPKTLREVSPTRLGYVAVSYPCCPSVGESPKAGGYIIDPKHKDVTVRDVVLDRMIAFIQYRQFQARRDDKDAPEMMPLWIDQISIDQENSAERNAAMQSMDLVYQECSYAVGYLWVEIRTQLHLNLLAALLRGEIIEDINNSQWPTLADNLSVERGAQVLELLLSITGDRWWQRAWIFQEDYLAGLNMWLVIRCKRGLQKSHLRDTLEDLSGEVVVNSAEFKKYATLFCFAYGRKMRRNQYITKNCETIIERAGKYNILHKYKRGGKKANIQKAMTIRILKDLTRRKLERPSDLLAIAANACGYDIRIDAENSKRSELSLSILILGLHVRNGDIINNSRQAPGNLHKGVVEFLEDQSIVIDAPLDYQELTFMKHSRLSVIKLSSVGVHAKGILWALSKKVIRPPRSFRRGLYLANKSQEISLSGYDYRRNRLLELANLLQRESHSKLAQDLKNFARTYKSPIRGDEWSSQRCRNIMAAYIVRAMNDGKFLRLGFPIGDGPLTGPAIPYRAIFVRDDIDPPDSDRSFVFTSWNRTEEETQGEWQSRSLAKYTSLVVKLDETTGGRVRRLRTEKWINGLCFFNAEKMSEFVFPWPESLLNLS